VLLQMNFSTLLANPPVVTIAGHTVTADPAEFGHQYYSASYNMDAFDAVGPVNFTVSFFDFAGNTGYGAFETLLTPNVTFGNYTDCCYFPLFFWLPHSLF
jgi:hypothetical protein